MSNKVLIVSYTFPPASGVGGRRWSKLSLQLAQRGHTVHIITASSDSDGEHVTENWNGVTVHRIPGKYPRILTHFDKKNILQKISYRLNTMFLKYTVRGNIFDRSVKWRRLLQKSVIELVRNENIHNIIVSAPPFQQLYYIAELKKRFPKLNIILDFRDPWVELPDFHKINMSSMPKKRMRYQEYMEKYALLHADYVVGISAALTENLRKFGNGEKEKYLTVTNGFDSSDYHFPDNYKSNPDDEFRILYNGSLYLNTGDTNQRLVEFINKNCETLVKRKVKFEFCGHISQENLAIFEKADNRIFAYHGFKPVNEALSLLQKASVALFITDLGHQDIQFNTKLMDYIALRKKIFLIGPAGAVSRFITDNRIGVQFTNETMDNMLEWIMNREKLEQLSYRDFDTSPFEFSNLSKQFERILV